MPPPPLPFVLVVDHLRPLGLLVDPFPGREGLPAGRRARLRRGFRSGQGGRGLREVHDAPGNGRDGRRAGPSVGRVGRGRRRQRPEGRDEGLGGRGGEGQERLASVSDEGCGLLAARGRVECGHVADVELQGAIVGREGRAAKEFRREKERERGGVSTKRAQCGFFLAHFV